MAGQLQAVDNRDIRMEVWICLQKMTAQQRIDFLQYCCMSIGILGIDPKTKSPIRVIVTNNSGELSETFLDFFALISGFGLNATKALEELERRASAISTPGKIYVPGG